MSKRKKCVRLLFNVKYVKHMSYYLKYVIMSKRKIRKIICLSV